MEKPTIVVTAWAPRPENRTDLIGTVAIDSVSLNELASALENRFPDYQIQVNRIAMAGMYGPPEEAVRWYFDVQIPWDDLAGPTGRAVLDILREMMRGYFDRRRQAEPADTTAEQQLPPEQLDEVVRRIPIYGPNDEILSTVEEDKNRRPRRRPGTKR